MLEFSVLSSGSKGNCTFVSSNSTGVLFDCGLSARQVNLRLSAIGADLGAVQAIVVSHEHGDHVRGIKTLLKTSPAVVYTNQATLKASSELKALPKSRIKLFETGCEFELGELRVDPVSISHDAADPVGFCVSNHAAALGLFTDLGFVSDLVREKVKGLDALVLESNHDLELLQSAPYPWDVKKRIQGRNGHLSNESSAELLQNICACSDSKLQLVVAAHISQNSNRPELALGVLEAAWQAVEGAAVSRPLFVAAGVKEPTEIFQLKPKEASRGSRLSEAVL